MVVKLILPTILPLLYLAAIGIDHFIEKGKFKRAARILFLFLFSVNLIFLVFRTIMPARELLYYHWFLYGFAADKKIELVCIEEDRLYHPSQLPIHFYQSPNITIPVFADVANFQNYLNAENPESIYLLDQNVNQKNSYSGYSQKKIFSILPEWVKYINFNDWTSHAKIWEIKELRKL